MFACSYAVTVLHGYDKVQAIKEVAGRNVIAAAAVGEAAGATEPFKKSVSEQRRW